jgi:ferrochelatase
VAAHSRPDGVLLVNLGSPASPRPADVRRYLKEFLSDPRVLDMPAPLRWLLLRAVILPFRPRRSARQYASIWTAEGSPLIVHGRALAEALGARLGDGHRVALAMRYGEPSIADGLEALLAQDVARIRVVPLFPHSASSSSGSAVARVYALASRRWNVPDLDVLGPFYDDPGFIAATAEVARPVLEAECPDFVLFSYHGLPETHIRRADPSAACRLDEACCSAVGPANRFCYRAQCFATTRAVAAELGLASDRHASAFQSRLGPAAWIGPQTDKLLPQLRERGVSRLAVLCPSFVADCLETLEEIGIRAREQWLELGGEDLHLVPCVNTHPTWIDALAAALGDVPA